MRWLVALALALAARVASADDVTPPRQTPFDRGRFGFGVGGGTQSDFDSQYIWIGASAGYFVLDGLELGVSGLHEFLVSGAGPGISQVSPSLRYVAQPLVGKWPVIPYVGAFYSHWFIDGNPDVNTIGGRAGLLFVSRADRGWLVLGLGAAYEHVIDACTQSCDSVYPDVTIGFVF